jgi:hypothetical protein
MATHRPCRRGADSSEYGRLVPGPSLVVVDEIDVLEALVRSGLPDGRDAVAALLCDPAGQLIAVVHCISDQTDTASLLARRLAESSSRVGPESLLSSVWLVALRSSPDRLTLDPAEYPHYAVAGAILADVGIETGPPMVMGPDGWQLAA